MKYLKLLVLAALVAAALAFPDVRDNAVRSAMALLHTDAGKQAAPAEKAKQARPPVPATVASVVQKEMPVDFRSVGSVQAESTVILKVRVESVVEKVLAADGSMVREGDVIVELDKRQIEAQIEQAKAAILRDDALKEQALRNEGRFSELMQRGITSRVTADDAKTAANVIEANKAGNMANLKALELQRSFYTIKAPISGRLGVVNVRPGAFLRNADANSIVGTINQIDPIYVAIAVPQSLLGQIAEARDKGTAVVELTVPGTTRTISGPITMIDNAVDPLTGLLTVRAKVANPSALIWPGQVADARLIIRREPDAIVVPNLAVQTSQSGNFVFVVDDQSIARVRRIEVARNVGTEAVIASGLKPGERVVTDGHLRLTEGATVAVASKPKTSAQAGIDKGSTDR